ncbi:pyruvate kinase [Lutibaculum baratangense]|uniref:Pyruvate kinase n=1 Tax=Lutibaculum baratangense AMV1 TaxID=631454 RepID=V4R8C7_9HYPH|nr:pyruvate kinase [Lutibaculum baratangense]ESR22416.1 Pyruvate kinase family protein [Lutibaculum baratangense AMV1]
MQDAIGELRRPEELLDEVTVLRSGVAEEGRRIFEAWRPGIVRRSFQVSALNFAHYLALRRRDLRGLQSQLMVYGLSSLGRLEGRVLANLDAVGGALRAMAGEAPAHYPRPHAFFRGQRLLASHAEALLGPQARPGRDVRIMVTLPSEAADEPHLLLALARAGAEAVRINCAHDDAERWERMVAGIRHAEVAVGRRMRILMDLGGPKCRTAEVRHPPDRGRIAEGDVVLLVRDGAFVPLEQAPFQAACGLPGVVDRLRSGDPVFVDDGKLGGVVEAVSAEGARIRVTRATAKGRKLKPDQGLNFPATDLGVVALTDRDRADLDFVAGHADVVGYSFVQSADDVRVLQRELAVRRPNDWNRIGVIAKIETPHAVRNLPEIIVAAASCQPFGVMIARGDLAVELGFERLAEMQEEMMWLCEAAHVPVVWATQVLESLVKKGLPTRGDMTDAAMSARAECVMLNKGPNVVEAVNMLDRLLVRMAEHQTKKTPRLRALTSW